MVGVGDAPALVVEGAGGDLARRRVARRADGGEREAGDLVLGGGQADHVEAVGHGPEHACRRSCQAASRRPLRRPRRPGRRPARRRWRRAALRARRRRAHRWPGRSTGTGRGSAARSRSSAAAASNGPISALGFSAVKASTTGTPVDARVGDQPLGGGDAAVPVRGARPAIVDDQRQRGAAGRQLLARIEDRLGQRQHDQRGHQQAQQRQPPWALVRRLLLLQDARQDPQRRKDLRLRLRRRQAQQPPDHRQREQAPQHGRKAEGERQPAHARTPAA